MIPQKGIVRPFVLTCKTSVSCSLSSDYERPRNLLKPKVNLKIIDISSFVEQVKHCSRQLQRIRYKILAKIFEWLATKGLLSSKKAKPQQSGTMAEVWYALIVMLWAVYIGRFCDLHWAAWARNCEVWTTFNFVCKSCVFSCQKNKNDIFLAVPCVLGFKSVSIRLRDVCFTIPISLDKMNKDNKMWAFPEHDVSTNFPCGRLFSRYGIKPLR